jgi:hypothetical protein
VQTEVGVVGEGVEESRARGRGRGGVASNSVAWDELMASQLESVSQNREDIQEDARDNCRSLCQTSSHNYSFTPLLANMPVRWNGT